MKILLLYPQWTINYGLTAKFARKISVWPPLNLAYLAAIAEEQGHQVAIIDGEAEGIPISQMVLQAEGYKPDIIGLTGTTPFYHITAQLAQSLKEALPKTPIAIGGTHITILKEEAFHPCFTYGFIGEAELSWAAFLKKYSAGNDVTNTPGLMYRQNGNTTLNPACAFIENLDTIPFPARHLLKMKEYKLGTMHGSKPFTSIMFSRGCPFSCIFCNNFTFGRKVRKHSPMRVVNEIRRVVEEFNIRHFYFADDNLTLDQKWVLELCRLIKAGELDITFESSTRANLVDEEMVGALASAGLIRLSFGLESVDANIRRIIKKEVPLEAYTEAANLCNKYNIETLNSVMLGLPGETQETIKDTLKYLRHAKGVHEANYNIAIPYPGTEMYRMAKQGQCGLKLLTEDFSQYCRNKGVMLVGKLTPDDLTRAQNDGIASIYLAPWRVWPMLRRMGLLVGLLTYWRVLKSLWHKVAK